MAWHLIVKRILRASNILMGFIVAISAIIWAVELFNQEGMRTFLFVAICDGFSLFLLWFPIFLGLEDWTVIPFALFRAILVIVSFLLLHGGPIKEWEDSQKVYILSQITSLYVQFLVVKFDMISFFFNDIKF